MNKTIDILIAFLTKLRAQKIGVGELVEFSYTGERMVVTDIMKDRRGHPFCVRCHDGKGYWILPIEHIKRAGY